MNTANNAPRTSEHICEGLCEEHKFTPTTTRTPENIVSSFFYYMWNRWCEAECRRVFPENPAHFWNKWRGHCDHGVMGAAESFYSALSTHNRALLVARAIECYNENFGNPP